MLLASDVGGTTTRIGLFARTGGRPEPIDIRSYPTAAFSSFTALLDAFARDAGTPLTVEAAAAGVAGPVEEQRALLTKIPWAVTAAEIAVRCGTPHVRLLNDLEAMGGCVEWLRDEEMCALQTGVTRAGGHAAILAAGTGLGEAFLYRDGDTLRPIPSEGGHADYAARTPREFELATLLHARYGRAEVDQVVSGPGLVHLHDLTHRGGRCGAHEPGDGPVSPGLVSDAGLAGTCAHCAEALGLFVDAYGAEAGNLALRTLPTAGLYVGGGIAPKILPALRDGRFMAAFRAKAPMERIVTQIPVRVILHPEAGLLGAAIAAAALTGLQPAPSR